MRFAIIAATLGGMSVLAAVACSSKTGSAPDADAGVAQDAPDVPDALDAAPPPPYPLGQVCPASTDPSLDACAKCSRESCCDTRLPLLSDAGDALVDCLQKPSCGADCQDACFKAAPAHTAPFLEHYACLAHRCPAQCAADVVPTPCSTCTEKKCLRESVACDLTKDCFVFSTCVNACNKAAACVKDCETKYPAARPLTGTLVVCISNLCSPECS